MARQGSGKSWFQETAATVVGSALILVIQTQFGLNPPRAATTPPLTTAPDRRARALRYFEQAMASAQKGDLDRAIAHDTQAIRLDQSLAPAYVHRGRAYAQKGQLEQAIRDSSAALRLDPGSAFAYLLRGWAFGQAGQYEQAIRDCTEALRLDPSLTQAYQIRSWACAQGPAPALGTRHATAPR